MKEEYKLKQTIPFKKDITFKTKIGELTAISLDNDLTLKGEDLIVGNFYINGNYKMLKTSEQEEEYSYKIPCEIAISEEYDTYNATIDIDDFYYEIINDEILRVNITLIIDNLERKEKEEAQEKQEEIEILRDEDESEEEQEREITKDEPTFKDEIKLPLMEEHLPKNTRNFFETKDKLKDQKDNYITYKVYIYKEEDTIEKVLEKYNITKEQLTDYNNIEDIKTGSKLVIPSSND